MMKQEKNFVVKGDICFSENPTQVTASEQSFAVCVEGECKGYSGKFRSSIKAFRCWILAAA